MSGTIARLNVLIAADARPLTDGLTRASRTAQRGGKDISVSLNRVDQSMRRSIARTLSFRGAIATLAGSAGIGLIVARNMKAIDSLAKFSDTIGESTENVQAFRRQADLAGVSTSIMDNALQRASRRAAEAADGAGAASNAYERLGLNAKELITLSPAESFQKQAEAIRNLSTRSDQLRAANEIFGRSAEDVIRIIDMGSDSFSQIRAEMDRTGESISRIDAARIEEANDALVRARGQLRGMGQQLTVELAPTITAVANHLQSSFGQAGEHSANGMQRAVDAAVNGFATVIRGAGNVVGIIEANPVASQFGILGWVLLGPKGAMLGGIVGGLFSKIGRGIKEFGGEWDDRIDQLADYDRRIADLQQRINNLQGMPPAARAAARDMQIQLNHLQESASALREELGEDVGWTELESQLRASANGANSFRDALHGLADTMRQSREDRDQFQPPEVSEFSGPGSAGVPDPDQRADEFLKLREQLIEHMKGEELALRDSFERRRELVRNNTDEESEERQRLLSVLNEQEREGLAEIQRTRDEHRRRDERNERMYRARLASMAGDSFGMIVQAAQDSGREQSTAAKRAAQAQAAMHAAVAITRAWADVPWPANIGFAAIVAASTAVQIGKIDRQGYASGGHVTGRAGTDVIPANLTRGEFVLSRDDVRRLGGTASVDRMRRTGFAEGGPVGAVPLIDRKGSGSVVNIHNYSGEQTQQRTRRRGDGSEEVDIIIGAVNQGIDDGRLDGAARRAWGLNRRGVA